MNLRPRKLPTPKQRADGQWVVRWRYTTPLGVEHRPQELFPTQADANAWILSNLADESNLDRKASRLTFESYADKYLNAIAGDVKVTTLNRERGALSHARHYFRGKAVADIRPSDCREFRAALQAGGCTEHRRKITRAASVKQAYRTFRAALDLAVEDNALNANPAVTVVRSRNGKTTKQAKFKAVFLSAEQVASLAEVLTAHGREPYDLLVRFVAYTGLRAGEVSGLNCGDIHLRKGKDGAWRGYVDVHRTRRKEKGQWVDDTPKSEKSTRHVNLPGWLAADLHEYLTERDDDPDAPLFPGRRVGGFTHGKRPSAAARVGMRLNWSEPVEMGSFYRNVYKPAAKLAGLPETLRFHDLRHSFAAIWLTAGGDIHRLSEQMGHESYQTTLNFYAHLVPEDEDAPHVLGERPTAPPKAAGDNVVSLAERRGRSA